MSKEIFRVQLRDVSGGSSKLIGVQLLKGNYYKHVLTRKNGEWTKEDQDIGQIYVRADDNSFSRISHNSPLDYQSGSFVDYIPEGHDWVALTLDHIGIIVGSDKSSVDHNYLNTYERVIKESFPGWREEGLNLMEIGVCRGASLRMWSYAMSSGLIHGLDVDERCKNLCQDLKNVDIFISDVKSPAHLDAMLLNNYEVIIDDGSHLIHDVYIAFDFFWDRLAKGGIYIIEDTSCFDNKSYIDNFPDEQRPSNHKLEKRVFLEYLQLKVQSGSSAASLLIYKNLWILKKNR